MTLPYEVAFPKSLPVKLVPTPGFCDENSAKHFYVKGQFSTGKNPENPLITFKVNSTTYLFILELRPGDGKGANLSSYAIWSELNGLNASLGNVVVLRDLDPKLGTVNFNLTITCVDFASNGKFNVVFNYWDPAGDPNGIARTSTNWDILAGVNNSIGIGDVAEVKLQGSMTVYYAGFTSNQCLGLAPNGLAVTLYGTDCQASNYAVCEHKSCYTTEGNECVFPFYYKNVRYTNCTSVDVYIPWCATKVNSTNNNTIISWGLCLPDCAYEVPVVSCLAPPPVPQFGLRNSSGHIVKQNYRADWFNLAFINNSDGSFNFTTYSVTRASRLKLYQPWMTYNASQVTETNLQILVGSSGDFFNDVYEIVLNGSNATYTCPLGWVFEDSHNISQYAYCLNWTWVADFDTSKACVRKYYLKHNYVYEELYKSFFIK